MAEDGFQVAATVDDAENQYVSSFNLVDDNVVADSKTAGTRAEILIAVSTEVRLTCEKREMTGDGTNQAVSNLGARAFLCNEVPDIVEISFRSR